MLVVNQRTVVGLFRGRHCDILGYSILVYLIRSQAGTYPHPIPPPVPPYLDYLVSPKCVQKALQFTDNKYCTRPQLFGAPPTPFKIPGYAHA